MQNSVVLSLVLIVLAAVGFFLLAPARHMLPEDLTLVVPATTSPSSRQGAVDEAASGATAGAAPISPVTPPRPQDTAQLQALVAEDNQGISTAEEASDPTENGTSEPDIISSGQVGGQAADQAKDDESSAAGSAADGNRPAGAETPLDSAADQTGDAVAGQETSDAQDTALNNRSEAAQAASRGPGLRAAGGDLTLGALAYDTQGNIIISGAARPDSRVRVSVNGRRVGEVPVSPEGTWQFVPTASQVPPGGYTLRVEALDADGAVVARTSTPFRRVSQQEAIAAASGGDVFVVQPGDNLWQISIRVFDDGTQFVRIFEENRDSISNPDLINPGQVLRLPAGAQ